MHSLLHFTLLRVVLVQKYVEGNNQEIFNVWEENITKERKKRRKYGCSKVEALIINDSTPLLGPGTLQLKSRISIHSKQCYSGYKLRIVVSTPSVYPIFSLKGFHSQRRIQRGRRGLEPRSEFKSLNFY